MEQEQIQDAEIVDVVPVMPTDCPAIEMTRNDEIVYRHLIKGETQDNLANEFNISRQRVSKICQLYFEDEKTNKRVVAKWKKDMTTRTMRTAQDIVQSIDITKLNDNSKATNAAILIDKSLLLSEDSASRGNVQVNVINYGDLTISK
jgi:hypothetical protein